MLIQVDWPTFALPSDYAQFKGYTNPQYPTLPNTYYNASGMEAELQRVAAGLISAQQDILGEIKTARYKADPITHLPVDDYVNVALTQATCAQFDWFEATGSNNGSAALYSHTSVGSVSLAIGSTGRGQSMSAADTMISERALLILANAGLRSSMARTI